MSEGKSTKNKWTICVSTLPYFEDYAFLYIHSNFLSAYKYVHAWEDQQDVTWIPQQGLYTAWKREPPHIHNSNKIILIIYTNKSFDDAEY